MVTKTASAMLEGDGLRLVAATGSGHTIVMDNVEGNTGPRPAELLLVAQAGCTAMDVVSILRKKRQPFIRYEVNVSGEQRDDPAPHVYERIEIAHLLDGADLDGAAVRRAIELSATRHCAVTAMLSAGPAQIHHRYLIRRGDGRPDDGGEVVVTGPGRDPDAPHATPAVSVPIGEGAA
jgi:putative redox protein